MKEDFTLFSGRQLTFSGRAKDARLISWGVFPHHPNHGNIESQRLTSNRWLFVSSAIDYLVSVRLAKPTNECINYGKLFGGFIKLQLYLDHGTIPRTMKAILQWHSALTLS